MSFEIPLDLIHQLQISLRKQAKISSYNPNDSSLLNLPIASKSISELDPSPPHLRCKCCSARLLRGEQSVICVFCGKQLPQGDDDEQVNPNPISFNSTLGCKWLLQSLNLDGSETVESISEAPESSGAQEALLSDLLDLQIKWTEPPEVFDVRATDETPFQKNNSGLPVAVLDNSFVESKEDSVFASKIEQLPPNEGSDLIADGGFQVRENINLFENVQPSETAAETSTQDESRDSFSAWDAEFQSADFKTVHAESETGAPLAGSTVDFSTHLDSIFGSGKVKDDTVSSSSNTNDWFHDDLWSSSSKAGNQTKQIEETTNRKDGGKVEITSNSSSVGIDLIQDNQWQTSGNNDINDNSGSHDASGDFTISTGGQDSLNSHKLLGEVAVELEDDSSDTWNYFTVSPSVTDSSNQAVTHVKIDSKESGDRTLNKDSYLPDSWNEFNSASCAQDPSPNETINHTTSSNDAPDHKTFDHERDSFDNWNDFTSSTGVNSESFIKQTVNHANEALESKITDQDVDQFDVCNDFSSSTGAVETHGLAKETISSKKAPDAEIPNREDDPFGALNDFTNSTSAQDPSNGSSNMDAIFGSEKVKDNTVSSASNAKQLEVTANSKDGVVMENISNSSSVGIDWIQDNQWKNNANMEAINNNRESFDASGDFTTSIGAHDPLNGFEPPNKSGVDGEDASNDLWNDFTATTSVRDSSNHVLSHISSGSKTISVDSGLFDTWNDFDNSSGTRDPPSTETTNHITSSKEEPDHKITNKEYDDSFAWNYSTNSTGENDPSVSARQTVDDVANSNETQLDKTTDQDEDSFGNWNDFTSTAGANDPSNGFPEQIRNHLTSSNEAPDGKTTDQDDDSFDDWNDFMSSTDAKDPSKGCAKQTLSPVTSSNEAWDCRTADQSDDSSNAWNAFTSSINAKDPFKGSVPQRVDFVTSSSGAQDSKTIDEDDYSMYNFVTSSSGAQDSKTIDEGDDSKYNFVTSSSGAQDSKTIDEGGNSKYNFVTSSSGAQDSKTIEEGDDSKYNFVTSSSRVQGSKTIDEGDDSKYNFVTSSSAAQDSKIVDEGGDSKYNFVTSSSAAQDSKTVDEGSDSFDTWNDFVSSTGSREPYGHAQETISQPTGGNSKIPNQQYDSFDAWNHFTGLSSAIDPPKGSAEPTVNSVTSGNDSKMADQDEDSLDAWNDFISSPGVQEPYGSAIDTLSRLTGSNKAYDSKSFIQDPFDAWNNFNSFTKVTDPSHQTVDKMGASDKAPNKIADDRDDDVFDDWNDFQSSTTAQDAFDILSKSSLFSGESSNQRSYEVNFMQPKASISSRTDDPRDGGNVDPVPKGEDALNLTTISKPGNVDIFSDISFMFQSNFSKPSKTGRSKE